MDIDRFALAKRFVHVGQNRIAYNDEGEGPPAVLVHGRPFSALVGRRSRTTAASYPSSDGGARIGVSGSAIPDAPRIQGSAVELWLGYVERRVFPGGCFMVATLSEFERQVAVAQTSGDLPPSPNAEMLAFEIDALLSAANVDRNLRGNTTPLDMARSLIDLRLAAP